MPKLRKPRYTLYPNLVVSDEVTPVVQRAIFWGSRQSIELISHSVKILIYPTLQLISLLCTHPDFQT